MTRTANARLAGFTFLFYIAAGLSSMSLYGFATRGSEPAARLEQLAAHAGVMRATVVLTLACSLSAIVLGVTLHALTRDEDADLALLGLTCRVAEGIAGLAGVPATFALLRLARSIAAAEAPDPAAQALAAHLLGGGGGGFLVSATLFAVGSALFSVLFLRARSIPVLLAWLGVVASALLVVALPVQIGGLLAGLPAQLVWLPMLVFELILAFWLMVKGVAAPRAR